MLVTNSKWDGYEPRLVTIRSEYENSERGAVQQFMRDDRMSCLGVGGIAIPYEQYQDVKPAEKTFSRAEEPEEDPEDIGVVQPDPASIEGAIIKDEGKRTYYYTFEQKNSGGYWDLEYHFVIIEAPNADEANDIAEKHGVYFDSSRDCSCCGSRWSSVYEDDATDAPEIFSDSLDVDLQADVDTHIGTWGIYSNPYIIHRYKG